MVENFIMNPNALLYQKACVEWSHNELPEQKEAYQAALPQQSNQSNQSPRQHTVSGDDTNENGGETETQGSTWP